MMDERQVDQGALLYEFSVEKHVPVDHMLRSNDRFVDLGDVRRYLAPFYSTTRRPSVDPELLISMLIIGYCYGIPSERRLCEEVHLHLGYRWCCRLGLAGEVPDHSTFSKNRHGRCRESDLLRQVFETGAAPLPRRGSRRRRRLCGRRQPDQSRCRPPEGRRRPGLGAGGVAPRRRRGSGRAG
jgi:transposase